MAPPRIMFDDGSRIMGDVAASSDAPTSSSDVSPSARGAVPLNAYYEIDRVAKEAMEKLDWSENTSRGRMLRLLSSGDAAEGADADGKGKGESADGRSCVASEDDDGFLCRIALQFPDELLADAPEVSWLMEAAIADAYKEKMLSFASLSTLSSLDEVLQSQLNQHLAQPPLLFVLGDTTYGACCPDEVSANHLNANLIVHYGHACLAPTECVPVVYAFGVSGVGAGDDGGGAWQECVKLVLQEVSKRVDASEQVDAAMVKMSIREEQKKKLLLLYDVKYHHAMDELKRTLEGTGRLEVAVGAIPKQQLSANRLGGVPKPGGCGSGACGSGGCSSDGAAASPSTNACCATGKEGQSSQSCCANDASCDESGDGTCSGKSAGMPKDEKQYIPRTIGGLEIPNDLELNQHTVLYIGDDLNIESYESNAPTRLLHILLRCNAPDGPSAIWSYSPLKRHLSTDVLNSPLSPTNSTTLSTALSRTLRRRYFLLNKAKLATTIAILIGTTSNSYSFRKLLSRTRRRIQSTGRTAYTFAVGKLSSSASKLTNFAEIDCFVLIACQESIAKFWRMEREEMLVPVLTPLELEVALGFREWDGRYSCDFGDLVRWDEENGIVVDEDVEGGAQDSINPLGVAGNAADDDDGSSDDEPFFSMISGKYEQSKTIANTKQDLEALPGQGKLIEYRSEAAEFLKRREYRGLEANVGKTEVKAAVKGQVGIASNYGEKPRGHADSAEQT